MKLKDMPIRFRELYKELRIIKKRDVIIINEFSHMEFLHLYDYIFQFCKDYNLLKIYDEVNRCIGFAIDQHMFTFKKWTHYNSTVYGIYFNVINRESKKQ